MTTVNLLPFALVVVLLIRAVNFFFSLRGVEPSGSVKFLLSLLGSILGVISVGHFQTIEQFGRALTEFFAAVQAVYATAKYLWRFLSMLRNR